MGLQAATSWSWVARPEKILLYRLAKYILNPWRHKLHQQEERSMPLCEFQFSAVGIFDKPTSLAESNLATNNNKVFHRDDRHVHGRMLKAETKIALSRIAVNNVTFSHVWDLITGGSSVLQPSL